MFKKYRNIKAIMPFYKKYKKTLYILTFVMLTASGLGMLYPALISQITIGITSENYNLIIISTLSLLGLVAAHHTFWFLWSKISSKVNYKVAFNIKSKIISSFLHLKYSVIKTKSSGYYLERLNSDTSQVSIFLTNSMGTFVDLLTNVGFVIYMFILNWQCALIYVIGVVVLFVIETVKIKRNIKYIQNIKNYYENSNSKFNETISAIKDIKSIGIKDNIEESNNRLNKQLTGEQEKQYVNSELLDRLKGFTTHVIDAIILLTCALWLLPSGQIEVVVILIIINFKSSIYDMIGFFAKIKDTFVQAEFCSGRLLEIINPEPNFVESFGKKELTNDFNIQIKNLNFAYEDNKTKILNNINLKINNNSATAFIGASGSGKTTLLNLLNKLIQTKNNTITIGDININELSENTIKANIFTVTQHPFIFSDTILNNLKIISPFASDEDIYSACKTANIHNEILNMPNGYNTKICENSSNLSGGQLQRIAIARAILKNAKIILFDEPTSALDKENQEIIMEQIKKLSQNHIVIVVAHNINAIKDFDKIVLFSSGKILACDTHNNLLNTCEEYKTLIKN